MIAHRSKLVWLAGTAILALALMCIHIGRLAWEIHRQSQVDEAAPSDLIVVLGAAEYRGFPSPVFRARLDHALQLYRSGMAPRLMTTGGAGGDPLFTEGEVGRDYLIRAGVPSEAILVEHEGETTIQSLLTVAEVMRRMKLRSAIVVSDGYHVFRAKRILESRGIQVRGSPRHSPSPGNLRKYWLYIRQAVAYFLWSLGVAV